MCTDLKQGKLCQQKHADPLSLTVEDIDRHTILPDANIRAVVLGSLILIMTAAKRCLQIK